MQATLGSAESRRTGEIAGFLALGRAEVLVYDLQVLYGRDAERAAIGALLEAARNSRGGALVLRGEPGIGKTALLEDAQERAADMHVLTARGIESESELPFAALHQLIRPALGHLEQLPAPQAAALRGALGLGEGSADERFLVFAASLSLLSETAERRPVLCVVDDAHWLDAASTDALLFVARRLDAEGVAMLFAAREGDVHEFVAADVPSLVLEGLNAEAAEKLLFRVAGKAAPAVRDRLVEQTRGNALALVEMAAALSRAQLAGEEPLPEVLPLTHQVESIFLERVRRLPEPTQHILLIAAADDAADAGLVTRAAELVGVQGRALDLAEQSGLISVHGNRLEFRHSLVRSAVYEAATFSERQGAHRALAEVLAQDDEQADRRAWHLAASTLGPDEDVACVLEGAAERAAERAGHVAAAKALERAAELSADAESRGRRLVGAARAARIAGADDYAVALASRADSLVGEPRLRAEIAYAIGVAEVRRGRPLDGFPRLVEAALDVSTIDSKTTLELLIWALAAASAGRDRVALAKISEVAAAVVSVDGGDASTFALHALAAFAQAREGDTATSADRLEEVFAWAAEADDAMQVFMVAVTAFAMGDGRRSAELVTRATSLARARGELGVLAQALSIRADSLSMAQRFDEADHAAGEAVQFARELGAVNIAVQPFATLALVSAIRGDDEDVRRRVTEEGESRAAHGLPVRPACAVYPLAMLDLGQGRWAEALERFKMLADPRSHVADPMLANFARPDTIEAAVRAGRLDEASRALSAYEEWVVNSGAAWAQPRLASCRALLAEGDEATEHFEVAIRLAPDARPFDLARIQLLYGEHLRRDRRRTDARVLLRAALEGFERLKAEPWAKRARSELRASGETARKRDPSTLGQLTPQELQIAGFVAEGLSNKEVAAQLYLSPRTIDYHLRNVFAKLGITSRTQLAGFDLAADADAVARASTPVPS